MYGFNKILCKTGKTLIQKLTYRLVPLELHIGLSVLIHLDYVEYFEAFLSQARNLDVIIMP